MKRMKKKKSFGFCKRDSKLRNEMKDKKKLPLLNECLPWIGCEDLPWSRLKRNNRKEKWSTKLSNNEEKWKSYIDCHSPYNSL